MLHFFKLPLFQKAEYQKAEPNSPYNLFVLKH